MLIAVLLLSAILVPGTQASPFQWRRPGVPELPETESNRTPLRSSARLLDAILNIRQLAGFTRRVDAYMKPLVWVTEKLQQRQEKNSHRRWGNVTAEQSNLTDVKGEARSSNARANSPRDQNTLITIGVDVLLTLLRPLIGRPAASVTQLFRPALIYIATMMFSKGGPIVKDLLQEGNEFELRDEPYAAYPVYIPGYGSYILLSDVGPSDLSSSLMENNSEDSEVGTEKATPEDEIDSSDEDEVEGRSVRSGYKKPKRRKDTRVRDSSESSEEKPKSKTKKKNKHREKESGEEIDSMEESDEDVSKSKKKNKHRRNDSTEDRESIEESEEERVKSNKKNMRRKEESSEENENSEEYVKNRSKSKKKNKRKEKESIEEDESMEESEEVRTKNKKKNKRKHKDSEENDKNNKSDEENQESEEVTTKKVKKKVKTKEKCKEEDSAEKEDNKEKIDSEENVDTDKKESAEESNEKGDGSKEDTASEKPEESETSETQVNKTKIKLNPLYLGQTHLIPIIKKPNVFENTKYIDEANWNSETDEAIRESIKQIVGSGSKTKNLKKRIMLSILDKLRQAVSEF